MAADPPDRCLSIALQTEVLDGGRLTPGTLVEALSRCLDPSLDGVQAEDL